MITLLWVYVQSKIESPKDIDKSVGTFLTVASLISFVICIIFDIAMIEFIFRR